MAASLKGDTMKWVMAVIIPLLLSCSNSTSIPDNVLILTGTIEVLAPGTKSETVVLEAYEGDRYALVGDVAKELVKEAGVTVTVTAVPTDKGWSVRPDYQKLLVIEYLIIEQEYHETDYY